MSSNSRADRFSSINEFTIISEIGRGGYSRVYLVEHKVTKRRYALKSAFRMKEGKDRSERAMTEIRLLRKLKHPNIIRLKGYFSDDEYIYMVLEFIEGKDCSKFFKHELPSKEQVKSIMKQLVSAVLYCHQKGVIHRDIKLENILIDNHGQIRLTDFGLSVKMEDDTEMFDGILGTSRYISAEMLAKTGYNSSTDVWAIGIVLFMLLTGSYPFDGSSKTSIFKRIREKTLHYSKYNLERKEVKLLRRLLEKDPNKRIEIEEILNDPFFE